MHSFVTLSLSALLLTGTASSIQFVHTGPSTTVQLTATNRLFSPDLKTLPPVYFCGESVPLHEEVVARRLVNALVRNTKQDEYLFQMRQRASRFFPIIEPILTKHNIPADFKYLPLVESALQGFAVSPRGATGYWQFMPATARELGLSVQPGHDDRKDLRKSTEAACRYLSYLHNRLGSWTLAAAAYNNGIGALLGNIRKQQQRDYYYLRLNAETGKYLYRILAFKELFSNSHLYEGVIPDRILASLRQPVGGVLAADDSDVLMPVQLINEATEVAINDAVDTPADGERLTDIPLPNAADVFRDGIRTRLHQSANLERGQTWVFNLTRAGMVDGQPVSEGDMLYAVVEDIDPKTSRIYLRADKVYSASEHRTYDLSLAAIDAATGRLGVEVPDIDQVRIGWTLTWKSL
ncbi:lytic transglycosylase domain-containing protein [Spirosoma rhododendri]|uniref:Lytic transglycosylase domain-containing protein n=1 Tax=Spirosoma rhododendri TaxID=2728024 RepID=A0A7L5DH23_9BACT|nr:lytic transglycosylase domain-containing protein [Spirosoma rhododendri]QJD77295.1 lytic transglycosylase domain-containing protein [Spirosoma rhododendri]